MKRHLLKYFWLFLGITALAAPGAQAASVGDKSGTTTGEFLRLGPGARATAMGEAYAAVADDVYALYWNPAGLARVTGRQLLVAHTMWYMDVNHEYAAYVHPLKEGHGALGISATYLMTTFEKRAGDTDAPDSNANIGDMAVGLSYGRRLFAGINGGATAKYISSTIDDNTASSFAFDAGLQYTVPRWQKCTLGLAVSNLGGSLKYIERSVEIGTTGDFGVAVQDVFFKNLRLALDYRALINGSYTSANAGAEYAWQWRNGLALAPRVGYESYDGQVTAGFGITWNAYQLDYAFLSHTDLGSTNRISFGISF